MSIALLNSLATIEYAQVGVEHLYVCSLSLGQLMIMGK